MEYINDVIKHYLTSKGAAIVGFGDITEIDPSIRGDMKYGISIAVAMTPRIVDKIINGPTLEYYDEYNYLNNLLNELVSSICKIIKEYGYDAVGLTTTAYTKDGNYRTELPHKTIATRAGIGWIGKCALLVTQQYGSAIRLSSILTNAPLTVATPINESKCSGCDACLKTCIGNAIKGVNWNVNRDRDEFYNATLCRTAARKVAFKVGLDGAFCGKCIAVCPYTKKYIKENLL